MLLQDLIKKLEDIKKTEEDFKQKQKEISCTAIEERVLEVDIGELVEEIKRLTNTKNVEIHYSPVYAPTYCAQNVENAKMWLKNRNPKVYITLSFDNKFVYVVTQNFANIILNNGEFASDNIYIRYITVGILNEFRNKVLLNINPLDKQLKNEIFKQAVFNCVTNKEKNKGIEHNI